MLTRATQRTLLRAIQRYCFTEKAYHATAPAYLTPDQIKETLPQEDYSRLLDLVKTREDQELSYHN